MFLDKRCTDLGKYVVDSGYNERMVCKETLRTRVIIRDTSLGKDNNQKNNNVILALVIRQKEVFPDVPLIDFKKNKRDNLVKSQSPNIDEHVKAVWRKETSLSFV